MQEEECTAGLQKQKQKQRQRQKRSRAGGRGTSFSANPHRQASSGFRRGEQSRVQCGVNCTISDPSQGPASTIKLDHVPLP